MKLLKLILSLAWGTFLIVTITWFANAYVIDFLPVEIESVLDNIYEPIINFCVDGFHTVAGLFRR